MKKRCYLIFFLIPMFAAAQNDSSIIVNKQKGILFISKVNPYYNWKGPGHVITQKTFSDFFFPIDNLENNNVEKVLESIHEFNNGIKLFKFSNRSKFKAKAKRIANYDSTSCYSFNYFYAILVTIEYKLYPYNQDASVCGKHEFDLKTKSNTRLHFLILNKGISDLKIYDLTP